jgi:hypothetical protein
MPSLGITSHVDSFLLGTTAPDAFEPDVENSFSLHHFNGGDRRISLTNFRKSTNFTPKPSDNSAWAFLCGYYSHLWLDVFFRENSDRISFKRPVGISDADMRSLVRKETEVLNAPFVLRFSDLSMEDFLCPNGLEFVKLERCNHLFHEVIAQSQAWAQSPTELMALDEAEYVTFLEDAAKLFKEEISILG